MQALIVYLDRWSATAFISYQNLFVDIYGTHTVNNFDISKYHRQTVRHTERSNVTIVSEMRHNSRSTTRFFTVIGFY